MILKIPKNMKSKSFFEEGEHQVTITEIRDGQSEVKGTPYFLLKFENETGEIYSDRFYFNENIAGSVQYVLDFFSMLGITVNEEHQLDTESLKGKTLNITVGKKDYTDQETGEIRTRKAVVSWRQISEVGIPSSPINNNSGLPNENVDLPF
jgi:hypothetical protein